MYFILTVPLNLDAKFSSELLDLYLYFIECTVGKVDLYFQIIPNIFKSSLITELGVKNRFLTSAIILTKLVPFSFRTIDLVLKQKPISFKSTCVQDK